MLLEAHGHRVTHVLDGAAAVEQFSAETPDLILMDVVMPIMDGLEATAQIRALPSKKWVPIMILSGLGSNEDFIKGLEVGADDYMAKPIDIQVLIARLRSKQRVVEIQNSLFGILENAHEGIITIDQHGKMQSFNLAAERIFGYAPHEVLGCNVNLLMPEPYKSRHDSYLSNYLTTQQAQIIGVGRKVQGQRKNGEIFPMHLAVTKMDSASGMKFIGLVRDISREEEDRQRIEHLALHDVLTGLPNRANFNRQINACVTDSKPFALLFIDIDGFKPINDNFGHEVGDQVLVALAQRMTGALAKDDHLSRLGGDEFVVILQNVVTQLDAEHIALRILEKISKPMTCSGFKCDVTASIGGALYPCHGQSHEAVLSAADNAMYEAKLLGKNQVVITR